MSMRYGYTSDAALNDSSKVFTVPSGETWIITHIHATLIATGDAGNRRLRVRVRDVDDTVIGTFEAGAVRAATGTQNVDFFPGAPDSTTEIAGTLKTSIPILILLPGWDLVVEDGAAIAASADDLTVSFVKSIKAT